MTWGGGLFHTINYSWGVAKQLHITTEPLGRTIVKSPDVSLKLLPTKPFKTRQWLHAGVFKMKHKKLHFNYKYPLSKDIKTITLPMVTDKNKEKRPKMVLQYALNSLARLCNGFQSVGCIWQ